MRWQLQEAKQRLSRVVEEALKHGPQVITRHGEDAVVVIAVDEYRRLKAPRRTFKEFLLAAPLVDELELRRAQDLPRTTDL